MKRVQTDKRQSGQRRGHERDKQEGRAEILAQRLLVPLPEAHGNQRAAAHAQAEENRGQKGHQRKRRADRRQRVPPENLPDDQRVGDVIALLKQVAQDHGNGKQQHRLDDGAFG